MAVQKKGGQASMKPKTIAQYMILKWLDNNFYPGVLTVIVIGDDKVRIKDSNGDTAIIRCNESWEVYMEED